MKRSKMLRIYASTTDKVKHTPLYEALTYAAKRYGMAGVTVYKGIMGYGASSEIFSNKFWELSDKVPVIIELVDDPTRIDRFIERIIPWLEQLPKGCLVAVSEMDIILHKQGGKG